MTTNAAKTQWQYLEKRPDSWRLEAADNWDLPLGAIEEVIRYCQTHQSLLQQEAEEEGRYLEDRGVVLEPTVTHR